MGPQAVRAARGLATGSGGMVPDKCEHVFTFSFLHIEFYFFFESKRLSGRGLKDRIRNWEI